MEAGGAQAAPPPGVVKHGVLYCNVLYCTVPVVGGHWVGLAGLQATGLRPPGFGREVSVLQ